MNLHSWSDFWDTFRLPVLMSLLGAMIGHYRKNGVIQMPTVEISYTPGEYLQDADNLFTKIGRIIYLVLDFLIFLMGIRIAGRTSGPIFFELGFLGDLLVGIGTGILAKTAVQATNTENDFVVISTALLAGFAGMSYFQKLQDSNIDDWGKNAKNGIDERKPPATRVVKIPKKQPAHPQLKLQSEAATALDMETKPD